MIIATGLRQISRGSPLLMLLVAYAIPVLAILIQQQWRAQVFPNGPAGLLLMLPVLLLPPAALVVAVFNLLTRKHVGESMIALVLTLPFAFVWVSTVQRAMGRGA